MVRNNIPVVHCTDTDRLFVLVPYVVSCDDVPSVGSSYTHKHIHHDGAMELHSHEHQKEHDHAEYKASMRIWVIFTIFVFGPCEPLIPILMYPAAKGTLADVVIVCTVFSIVTIGTMLAVVFSSLYGLSFVPMKKMEQYSHALGGFAIFMCGIAVQFLGL